jgi:hypothetical protein
MKRIVLISVILAVTTFAMFSAATADEKVNLKGTLLVTNKIHPELKSDKNYLLLFPKFTLTDVKEGDAAEVEGFKISGNLLASMGCNAVQNDTSKDQEYVMVSKITVNGKTIDIEKERKDFRDKMVGQKKQGKGYGMMGGGRGFAGCFR